MDYDINNELKYTTLQIKSILVKNKWTEINEKGTDTNPPRGDGEWAQKSVFQKWFYLLMVTVS